MEHKSGQENLYYTYTDYQGNLMAVTDASGNVKERYAYDPWGLRKNPTNWSVSDTRTSFLFSRGYTLHEHLDDFGLINMNGRVYDPLMAQFLSPDPYIQAPGSWMNYNRYAYCLNNPLMYSDPSGYNWFKDAWNWAWGKLNQFAIWADKNGIPSGGFGVGVQGDTPYYNANFAGLTYDTRYHNQFDPAVNANRSINEVRLAEGVVNYNPSGQGGNYFEDARVYTLNFGHFKNGAAMTIPGVGIFVGPGDANNIDLLRHEYGHILHYKKWGAKIFWGEIVPASLKSANKANSDWSFNHMDTWTEWSANRLSYQYFNQPTDWSPDYPIWPTTIRPGVMPPFVVGPFDFKYNWLDN